MRSVDRCSSTFLLARGPDEVSPRVVGMKLVGANPIAAVEGLNELEGKVNYLIGNDPAQWRTNIPTFSRVRYNEVYRGIDVVYYGNQRRLEYDFVVAPGADARWIRLNFDGADEMTLEADGSLRLKMKGGEITQPAPKKSPSARSASSRSRSRSPAA